MRIIPKLRSDVPLWVGALEFAFIGAFVILDAPAKVFAVALFAMPERNGNPYEYNDN